MGPESSTLIDKSHKQLCPDGTLFSPGPPPLMPAAPVLLLHVYEVPRMLRGQPISNLLPGGGGTFPTVTSFLRPVACEEAAVRLVPMASHVECTE